VLVRVHVVGAKAGKEGWHVFPELSTEGQKDRRTERMLLKINGLNLDRENNNAVKLF